MWNAFRRLIVANPMGLFIYGIIGKWYILIAIAALVVTFWVFKGLEKSGVIASIEAVVVQALNETKSVAKNCTPKITNLSDFWLCLKDPPKYESSDEDASASTLEESLNKTLKRVRPGVADPYDDEYSPSTSPSSGSE